MIVKIPPQRRDKGSSFHKLFDYLTEGLPENGADIDLISFHDLTQYITAKTVVDQMGDTVDKTLAVEIGNLNSLQTAVAEMYGVAQQNTRAQDPVFHYIISWPENEKPPVKDVLDAARYTIEALGLAEHQYVIAVHVNTDNLHAHIEVNKIHPVTYKSHHIEWSQKTLHKAARELEIKYGWFHDNGIFVVSEIDGKKEIVLATQSDTSERAATGRANAFETWSGQESFETWCKETPAKPLKALLEKASALKSWHDIHAVLAQHGIELQYSGGGYRVATLSTDDSKPVAIAASKVFRFLKPGELEKVLGKFVPYDPAIVTVKPEHTYKRDPLKRLVRREERRVAREELFKRYQVEKREAGNSAFMLKTLAKRESKEAWNRGFADLKKQYSARRLAMQQDKKLTAQQKQLLYMQLKLAQASSIDALKQECKDLRNQFAGEIQLQKSWRAWVEEEARKGDPAAISALRGMTYRDKRNSKGLQDIEADDSLSPAQESLHGFTDDIASIEAPSEDAEQDPTLQPLRDLKWTVTSNGRIVYSFNRKDKFGDRGFVDEGRRVIFGRRDVSDRALRAALEYSKLKWGPTLHLAGGDKLFQERVIKMAIELGMRIGNPEFHQRQMQAIHGASPVLKKSTSTKSTDKEIQKILRRTPAMRFDFAAHQSSGETYRGRIASVTETHVIQQVAAHQMILHDLSRLGSIPKSQKTATITYHGDTARVEQDISRNRRGGR